MNPLKPFILLPLVLSTTFAQAGIVARRVEPARPPDNATCPVVAPSPSLQAHRAVLPAEEIHRILQQTDMRAVDAALAEQKQFQKLINAAKWRAVNEPTVANVRRYLILQNLAMQHAEAFSNVWIETQRRYPYLSLPPSNQAERAVDRHVHYQKVSKKLKILSKDWRLWFFYESTCPHCQKFAPILKSATDKLHVPVLGISIDGPSLPSFPHSLPDHGFARAFHVTQLPTVLAVNIKTNHVEPLFIGVHNETEIGQGLLDFANQEVVS